MSEGLENFIRNRRREFDEQEPPADLWSKIEKGLDTHDATVRTMKARRQLHTVFRIAAIFAVVITAGLTFMAYQKNRPVNTSKISPQLAEQQVHYTSMIESRMTELEAVKNQEPHLYREFSSELQKLDKTYQRLKKDLVTSPNQEETLKAMVLNLQIQAQVLNQQLTIIQQIKQLKKEQQNENQRI
jgi:CHASE3 domain sensor protein